MIIRILNIRYHLLLLLAFQLFGMTLSYANEPDSLWLKVYNAQLKEYDGVNDDSIAIYHWRAFHMARAIENDSLQLHAMGKMRNTHNMDSLKAYIAVVDTFPHSTSKTIQKHRLNVVLYRRLGMSLEREEKHHFIEEMIYKADSVYADSVHKDSLSYLLNNRLYLSGLMGAVDIQSTTSPFYEYFNRFNKIVMKLPKEFIIDKINSFILSSGKYLALKDYENTLLYSEYVIDYLIHYQGKAIAFEEMPVGHAAIVYFMCYEQLCCYDQITPSLLARNWKFMNSPHGKEGKVLINSYDRMLHWADINYAMCAKEYKKVIELCNKEIISRNNNKEIKLRLAKIQNKAIKKVGYGDRYNFYLTRNFHIIRQQFQERLYDSQTDYSTLYKLIRLKRVISAENLEHQRYMSTWTTRLFISSIVLFLLGIWGLALTLHTIRKRKLLIQISREESRLAKKEQLAAERLNDLQVRYMHNMNHEIRTPLNAIARFSLLLTENPELDKEMKRELGYHIAQNSEMLLQLINDALDTAQLDSGRYTIHNDTHSVLAICDQAMQTINMHLEECVEMTLDFRIPEDTAVYTDKTRVLQILLNYLSNACKHTKNGHITLSCNWASDRDEVLEFAVTDTGTGVPEDKVNQLFHRFAKLDQESQGIGLGLSICASLAELLKGEVVYDRSYTGGARFLFYLPLVADANSKDEVAD